MINLLLYAHKSIAGIKFYIFIPSRSFDEGVQGGIPFIILRAKSLLFMVLLKYFSIVYGF